MAKATFWTVTDVEARKCGEDVYKRQVVMYIITLLIFLTTKGAINYPNAEIENIIRNTPVSYTHLKHLLLVYITL